MLYHVGLAVPNVPLPQVRGKRAGVDAAAMPCGVLCPYLPLVRIPLVNNSCSKCFSLPSSLLFVSLFLSQFLQYFLYRKLLPHSIMKKTQRLNSDKYNPMAMISIHIPVSDLKACILRSVSPLSEDSLGL